MSVTFTAYIQTEIARSNTPTKKYDVITICSDRRSEGQLSTAATTGPGMATGNALRREQAAIRRSDRRTHLGDVTAHWATACRIEGCTRSE
eukprot:scaffold27374_cov112-Isochrysis_galbana.AAC.4